MSNLNDLVWTEDMTPAEAATMMKLGGAGLSGVRRAAQMGGGAAPLMMTQRPAYQDADPVAQGAGRAADYVANLMSLFGTPTVGATPKAVPIPTNVAPAAYRGFQEGFGAQPGFHLWNLLKDIPGHPAGSTVSSKTLEALKYTLPKVPK